MTLAATEQERKGRNLLRLGVIKEADYKLNPVRYRVQDGDLLTDWLYPLVTRAHGDVSDWLYEVGEQVAFAFEAGSDGVGIIFGAIAQDKYLGRSQDPAVKRVSFADGNYVEHNRETGRLVVQARGDVVIKQGRVIVEDGHVIVNKGNVTVENGSVSVPNGDVVASGISLTKHVHEKTAPHAVLKSGKPE